MIYCVWYPSGGFGHFINAILSLYGKNFVRPVNVLEFSTNGNSHSLDLIVPKYLHNCWPGGIEFSDSKNYSVLVDNGIDNESTDFKLVLPDAEVIKICYTDRSWPIIARTSIEKALNKDINSELSSSAWDVDAPWAQREKYFLYLRDHQFRKSWKDDVLGTYALHIDSMCEYTKLFNDINCIVTTKPFEDDWQRWRAANHVYINPVEISQKIINHVKNKTLFELRHITDIWAQAVVYYFILIEFGIEVPHNDYSEWFTNTNEIVKMLQEHGVEIDSH